MENRPLAASALDYILYICCVTNVSIWVQRPEGTSPHSIQPSKCKLCLGGAAAEEPSWRGPFLGIKETNPCHMMLLSEGEKERNKEKNKDTKASVVPISITPRGQKYCKLGASRQI